jgi:hypothetical protein
MTFIDVTVEIFHSDNNNGIHSLKEFNIITTWEKLSKVLEKCSGYKYEIRNLYMTQKIVITCYIGMYYLLYYQL